MRIRQVSCNEDHTAAVGADGALYTWGTGEDGKLGHGDEADVNASRVVQGTGPWCHTGGGRVELVSCGWKSAFATTTGGHMSMWSWGHGFFGTLGHGDRQSRNVPTRVISEVFAGDRQSRNVPTRRSDQRGVC